MKESTRQVYHCEHCKDYYLRKKAAIKHEEYCRLNPNNRHKCWGCEHLEKDKVEWDNGCFMQEVTMFRCNHFKTELYSYIAERRDLLSKNPELYYDTVRMPLECDHWREKLPF